MMLSMPFFRWMMAKVSDIVREGLVEEDGLQGKSVSRRHVTG